MWFKVKKCNFAVVFTLIFITVLLCCSLWMHFKGTEMVQVTSLRRTVASSP